MIPDHSAEENLVSIWDCQRLDVEINVSALMTEGPTNIFNANRLMVANGATGTISEDTFLHHYFLAICILFNFNSIKPSINSSFQPSSSDKETSVSFLAGLAG